MTKTEGDGEKVKTQSSFRRVPIHRALIELGFLAFVAKAKPKGRLFPDIEPGADGYFSYNFSKWWGRYSRHVGFWEVKTTFHSFRHTFIDGMRNAKVPEAFYFRMAVPRRLAPAYDRKRSRSRSERAMPPL